jgi:hypothetical protein
LQSVEFEKRLVLPTAVRAEEKGGKLREDSHLSVFWARAGVSDAAAGSDAAAAAHPSPTAVLD